MEKCKITVIIPVYNGEKYLNECIDSIINQSYKNLEIIIVNDGSTDNSKIIIDNYMEKDNRIKALHKQNSGVSDSRNHALNIMTGEYVCFVDQDDYVDYDYIEYLYTLILENNADISVVPTVKKINEKTKNNYKEDNTEDNIKIINGEEACRKMLNYKFIIAPWNKMISSKVIVDNNLKFDIRYFSGEGFLFSLECYMNSNSVVVGNKKKYCYRCDNPNSGMTKFKMSIIDSSVNAQKTISKKVLEKYPNLKNDCIYANWHTHCDCLNFFVGCNVVTKYKEQYKKIKKICRKDAFIVFKVKITVKEKIKGLLYWISPYCIAKIINHFRVRKFTQEK